MVHIEVRQNSGEIRVMQQTIHLETRRREIRVDITRQVEQALRRSGLRLGLVRLYAQGATAAILIQENWDKRL
jgi:thiamine phosphate synthase YjbQ (UPF0047 family)